MSRPYSTVRLVFTFESGATVEAVSLNMALRKLGRLEAAIRCTLNGRDQWPEGHRAEPGAAIRAELS